MNDITAKLVSIRKETVESKVYMVVRLDQSPFFPYKGGQQSDKGTLEVNPGEVLQIEFCTECPGDIVDHFIEYDQATFVKLNDKMVQFVCKVDMNRRSALGRSHTAQHLLDYGIRHINKSFPIAVSCAIDPDKFTMDVAKNLTIEQLIEAQNFCNKFIEDAMPIHMTEVEFEKAKKIHDLKYKSKFEYPEYVRIVSMGFKPDVDSTGKARDEYYKNFFELCCGTHVSNSKHLKKMLISSISKIKPDVYRIVAICGDLAIESETRLAQFKSKASNVSKLVEKAPDASRIKLMEYLRVINSLTYSIQSTTLVIGSKKKLLDTVELSKSKISKIKDALMKEKINGYISTLETEIEASLEQTLFSKIIEVIYIYKII